MTYRFALNTILVAALVASAQLALGQTPAPRDQHDESHEMMVKGMSQAEFVPMTIKHHQDGIEMSRLEEQKGASAEVKALAAKIRQSQERDIPELKKHQRETQGTSHDPEHDKMDNMMEQQAQATMKRLKTATGQALDHAFLEEMAKHHQMAISMGESAKIQNSDLKKLVQTMVQIQRQELAELKKLQNAHGAAK
jgi:uncharacterized protein (DUF305 family)